MSQNNEKRTGYFFSKMKNYFITGLLILAPTMVTFWVLKQTLLIFDNILGKFYKQFIFGPIGLPTPPGLGAVTLALIIIFIGMSARFYAGRKLFELWDKTINYVPLINRVYIAVRQLSNTLKDGSGIVFQTPVLVQFPRLGLYSIGFITKHYKDTFKGIIGDDVVSVFIPTTPNPTTGFLVFACRDEITPLTITIEDTMKLIITAGTVVPDKTNSWI